MSDAHETPQLPRWRIASELPPDVFAAWKKSNRALSPVAIVSTVDADGTPRAAPFGSLRAATPRLLRFSPSRYQTTYTNLCRDGRVAVTLIAPPDIAVSIRGHARVIRESMAANKNQAILEIDIEEVKNDMVGTLVIENGITISARGEFQSRFEAAIGEIEGIT